MSLIKEGTRRFIMLKKDAVKHFGGIKTLAAILDVWPQTVTGWPDILPENRAYEVYYKSGHKVPLRPEDYENKNNGR